MYLHRIYFTSFDYILILYASEILWKVIKLCDVIDVKFTKGGALW